MARILVAFYNCIDDLTNPNAMPQFYETFIKQLDKLGNNLLVFSHKFFYGEFGQIELSIQEEIVNFDPEICFLFNNAFFDLSDIVKCPIVIYEVDSPSLFSNQNIIRSQPNKYKYFIIQQESKKTLVQDYNVNPKNIYYIPLFTEIYADHEVKSIENITFVGSLFEDNRNIFDSFYKNNPTEIEKEWFEKSILSIMQNPKITVETLIHRYGIKSELVISCLDMPAILMALSREKRIQVLSSVADYGMKIYGTSNWGTEYYGKFCLNRAYVNKKVYSLEQNQKIYNESKIGINVSHLQATSGFPWRVMDIMASNACLVTDWHSDFERLFPELYGILPIYSDPYEAREICKYLIDNEDKRQSIVKKCNEVINKKYRFKNIVHLLEKNTGVKLSKF